RSERGLAWGVSGAERETWAEFERGTGNRKVEPENRERARSPHDSTVLLSGPPFPVYPPSSSRAPPRFPAKHALLSAGFGGGVSRRRRTPRGRATRCRRGCRSRRCRDTAA